MMRALLAKLFAAATVTRIQTDPSLRNARAIRCYEQAGFRARAEVETPDGRSWLMFCDLAVTGATDDRLRVDPLRSIMQAELGSDPY